jgi:hypothetical protein
MIVVDFESIPLPKSNEHGDFNAGSDGNGGLTQHGVHFANLFQDFGAFTTWSGWSASNSTDQLTPGYLNQYAAIPGGGAADTVLSDATPAAGGIYAVAFVTTDDPARITLPVPGVVLGAHLTNSTYAALSMQTGDAFAKKFGGPAGTDPDFFELTIHGWDRDQLSTGSVILPLADFRAGDPNADFILDRWVWVDLSGLGANVASVSFSMASSDVGEFGVNTPTYFALDNLAIQPVPEPAIGLIVLAGFCLLLKRKRASHRP